MEASCHPCKTKRQQQGVTHMQLEVKVADDTGFATFVAVQHFSLQAAQLQAVKRRHQASKLCSLG
jgi:hypothetical protein